jgi:hypothetical protein
VFSDGVTWTFDQVRQMLLDQESAANGGVVYGYAGQTDTIVAGPGDKTLFGEGGYWQQPLAPESSRRPLRSR